MRAIGGASYAVTAVAIRSVGTFSIKCYHSGEFGAQGESGPTIWLRLGSDLEVRRPVQAVAAIRR